MNDEGKRSRLPPRVDTKGDMTVRNGGFGPQVSHRAQVHGDWG